MLQAVRLDVLGLLTDAYNESLHAVLLMLVPCRLHCSINRVSECTRSGGGTPGQVPSASLRYFRDATVC
jgi:hypothetical protein